MDSWSNNIIDKEEQTNSLNVEINHVHDNLCKRFVQSYSKFQYSYEFAFLKGRRKHVEKN